MSLDRGVHYVGEDVLHRKPGVFPSVARWTATHCGPGETCHAGMTNYLAIRQALNLTSTQT